MASDLSVSLHPLVLLTISDHITRHALRQQTGPIIGALLGQQSGRTITLEHAFECLIEDDLANGEGAYYLNTPWLKERIQQYKDVHQSPALDLVGWFTLAPETGPEFVHELIHHQMLKIYNDSAIMLAFHPAIILSGRQERDDGSSGSLPLTIYEKLADAIEPSTVMPNSDAMEIETQVYRPASSEVKDGRSADDASRRMRFRELPYTIETGEAEMIAVDTIVREAIYATSNEPIPTSTVQHNTNDAVTDEKSEEEGRDKAAIKNNPMGFSSHAQETANSLTAEDESLLASLNSRAMAVKMLQTRIRLLQSYLASLPPSLLTDESLDSREGDDMDHPLLRSIQALLSRLPLVLPTSDVTAFREHVIGEKADVGMISLLAALGQSINEARELGERFLHIESGRNSKRSDLNTAYARSAMTDGPERDGSMKRLGMPIALSDS